MWSVSHAYQCYISNFGNISSISETYFSHISIHLAQILGISKTNLYHLSGISQVPLMHMSGIYNNNSGISQAYLNDISSFSHSYLKHFSSISWVPKTSRTLRIRACHKSKISLNFFGTRIFSWVCIWSNMLKINIFIKNLGKMKISICLSFFKLCVLWAPTYLKLFTGQSRS